MKGDHFPQGAWYPNRTSSVAGSDTRKRRPLAQACGGASLARPGAARPRARVGVQDVGVPDGREAVAQRRRLRVELRQAEQQLEPAARRGQDDKAQSGQTVKACFVLALLRCLAIL